MDLRRPVEHEGGHLLVARLGVERVAKVGGDAGRAYDLLVNGELLVNETLDNAKPNQYIEKRYPLPAKFLDGTANGRLIIRFAAKSNRTAGVYDVRLMKVK